MSRDFTLDAYADLCTALCERGYPVLTLAQFLTWGDINDLVVVLRHDVDRRPGNALRMAELEAGFGLRTTYHLRKVPKVFREPIIRRLAGLGHEVGYHYEVLTKTRGDQPKARKLFARELDEFRRLVPVKTISMHGSPLTPWKNTDIWQDGDFSHYDLLGEAYLSVDYQDKYYFTDTGRSWDTTRFNIRDHTSSRPIPYRVSSTEDLIQFLSEADRPVIINVHPNRWTADTGEWLVSATSDWIINRAKWLLAGTYRLLGRG